MVEVKAHITEEKKKEVVEIKRLIHEYKVIGIVNLENLPAFNLMKIKSQLKGKLVLKYSKKRLMKIVFSESEDKNIQELGEKLDGIPALIFTNEDPFKLFQLLKITQKLILNIHRHSVFLSNISQLTESQHVYHVLYST